jgi:hypothetical protein
MNAIAVTVPAGWKFQSVFMQGGSCVSTPYGVFRTASQDACPAWPGSGARAP